MLNPDDPITSIEVIVHTAMHDEASTNDDVFISLFPDFPFGVELDSDDDDFEVGSIGTYALPGWYFAGRIVNDIRQICLHVEGNWGTAWGLGWIALKVNGDPEFLYQPPSMQKTETVLIWLNDPETYCVGDFKPIEFEAPYLSSVGLRDANSDEDYEDVLTIMGGRAPITWDLDVEKNVFTGGGPTLTPLTDTRQARLSGHTVETADVAIFDGAIGVTDADGRHTPFGIHMRVVGKLDPPTIANFTPTFGWPKTPPTVPEAVVVTVSNSDDNFDSRTADATKILFPRADGGEVEGQLVGSELTSSKIKVRVPTGAVPGKLKVRTAFGEGLAADQFTAHPSGFRFITGFPFSNSSKFFPDAFAWERYEETFGIDEMWLTAFDNAIVPDPVATNFWSLTQFFIKVGCCHGYGLASLQLQAGLLGTSGYGGGFGVYPLDTAVWGLGSASGPNSNLSDLIQSRQLAMLSDEAATFYLDKLDSVPNVNGQLCQMDARPTLSDVKASIGIEQWANPRMIALARRCWPWEGHIVVPYGVRSEPSVELENILVCDPNKPAAIADADDKKSYIAVKPGSGQWDYAFSDGNDWSGVYLFTIPFGEYGHQYDWSIPGFGTMLGMADIFLGCAGTDSAGRIVQVEDAEHRKLIEGGNLVSDRSAWPPGVRPLVQLGVDPEKHLLLALTRKIPLTFTVAPRGSQPALFSIVRGGDLGLTIEEISSAVVVSHEPNRDEISIVGTGKASAPILRIDRRLQDTCEGFRWSVRVPVLPIGQRLRVRPSPDRRGVCVVPETEGACDFEVRVEHRDRMGRTRTIHADGLSCPPGTWATLTVDVELLGQPDAAPLRFNLYEKDSDSPISDRQLAEHFQGPVVRLPARIVARPPQHGEESGPQTRHPVVIDPHPTELANPGRRIHLRARGETLAEGRTGPMLMLEGGSRPVRIVAEDDDGNRSFPHELFVTFPQPGHTPVPVCTISLADVAAEPGGMASIPISCFTDEVAAHDVQFALSARERISGPGGPMLQWAVRDTFRASPDLAAATAETGISGFTVQVHVAWNPREPRRGAFRLGEIRLHVPNDMAYGSTFVLRGSGTLKAGSTAHPLNVVPSAVRIWGGADPSALSIHGPQEVRENETVDLELAAEYIASATVNSGWWITFHGGRASLSVISGRSSRAALTGRRAGPVMIHAVCGRLTARRVVNVRAAQRPNVFIRAAQVQARNLLIHRRKADG